MSFGWLTHVSETANITEVSTSEVGVQSSAELRQHVTFPNHFQVPEALKSGLTFGSFDTFGPSEKSNSGTDGDNNVSCALEPSPVSDEVATSRFVIHMFLMCFFFAYQIADPNVLCAYACLCFLSCPSK